MNIELLDIDEQIWDEELEDFVPNTIFDAHTHLYKWSHSIKPQQEPKGWQEMFGKTFPNVDWKLLNTVDELLFPGRKVHRLTSGMPFVYCNFEAANHYTAS